MSTRKASRRRVLRGLALGAAALAAPASDGDAAQSKAADPFRSAWPEDVARTWVGPEYWANRLQDWRLTGGWVECVRAAAGWPMRTLHLLTRRLGAADGEFTLSARVARVGHGDAAAGDAAAGFLIGAGGAGMEYRAAALIHQIPGPGGGLFAGIDAAGRLFVREFTAARPAPAARPGAPPREVVLRLTGRPGAGGCSLSLSATDAETGSKMGEITLEGVEAARLVGNVALVSHPGTGANPAGFRFRDWEVAGAKLEAHEGRTFGPIVSALYTLHNRVLKLTAQLTPVGAQDAREAELQVRQGNAWKNVATARVVTPGYTVPFRVEKWDTRRDVPFRVLYRAKTGPGGARDFAWEGTVRRDPVEKETIVVASLSCVQQIDGNLAGGPMGRGTYRWTDRVWFPHHDMVPNLAKHRPDLFFFAGDQIYDGNPTRPIRDGGSESELDYLYKWYLWCWSFGDLVRHTPCICIPDDHDVYHGNVWGMGGKAAQPGDPGGQKGGYGMPPGWLNMMQRTQSSHLPDPHDPAPVEQGIAVYYTSLAWGGIGFAILEDRKFKSSPEVVKAEKTPDSHITEKDFDTGRADVPGATLLGERQLRFLREFSQDWRGQVMKAALSQTIFCNLQISSRGATAGELDKDLDSNGWPQAGRSAALRELRRGFMIHLAGDQHLASAVHHGIDEFEDAGWSLCSPAVANLYVRYWNPNYPPEDPRPGAPPFTGRFRDGFRNRLTVHAVANPVDNPPPGRFPEPAELHRKAPGYSLARFNKKERTITLEVWPRYADPADPKTGSQYPGWPISIRQEDNYARKAVAWLPTLQVRGMIDPVVRITDEMTGEPVYALRIRGTEFQPKVFAAGSYTVEVGEPGTRLKTLRRVATLKPGEVRALTVEL